jgi:hypothetical protein
MLGKSSQKKESTLSKFLRGIPCAGTISRKILFSFVEVLPNLWKAFCGGRKLPCYHVEKNKFSYYSLQKR